LHGMQEVVGSIPIRSTNFFYSNRHPVRDQIEFNDI
jgi:hypothetical protein